MTTPRHRALASSLAVVVSLAAALSLTGCFANPIEDLADKAGANAAQEGAEKLIEEASGGEADIELGGQMPKGFPESIPVVDGDIKTATRLAASEDHGQSWTVGLMVTDADKAMAQAREQLTSAGFAETLWNEGTGMTMGTFENDTYGVNVNALPDEDTGGGLISYVVIETQGTE